MPFKPNRAPPYNEKLAEPFGEAAQNCLGEDVVMSALPPLVIRPPEIMDDPSLDSEQHHHALHALARIHIVSRTASQIAHSISTLIRSSSSSHAEPLRVLDIACGGGDLTAAVANILGKTLSQPIEFIGLDMSDRAIDWARSRHATSTGLTPVSFHSCDVLQDRLPACTVSFHSLFLHHLNEKEAVTQIQSMAAASSIGFVFSDLLRTRLGLFLAYVGTTVLTSSSVARIDGPLSVKAARTLKEYHDLFQSACLESPDIRHVWPERALVSWSHS